VIFGCIEYWQTASEIRDKYHEDMRKFPLLMAGLIGLLGVLLLASVVFRIT
jgi:hypothetical protein